MFSYAGVHIRPIEDDDLGPMISLRADARVWMNLGDISMVNQASQQRWFQGLAGDPKRRYFILGTEEIEFLGIVRMDELDCINRSARVGGDILPEYQNKGYGTRMFKLLCQYAFAYLNLERLWLFVLEDNNPALRLYNKSGFVEEGRQRRAIFRDGRYQDYIMMSLLRPEWLAQQVTDEATR